MTVPGASTRADSTAGAAAQLAADAESQERRKAAASAHGCRRHRNFGARSYVDSGYAVWRCWSAWCRARCARGVTGLNRGCHPRPRPPCQIPRRTVSSCFPNCPTRVFGHNAVKSALGGSGPTFAQSYAATRTLRSNPIIATHTASRVGAAASPKHASDGPGDCECHVHTGQGLPRGCVAATEWVHSTGLSDECK